jgi:hypothetical protein
MHGNGASARSSNPSPITMNPNDMPPPSAALLASGITRPRTGSNMDEGSRTGSPAMGMSPSVSSVIANGMNNIIGLGASPKGAKRKVDGSDSREGQKRVRSSAHLWYTTSY